MEITENRSAVEGTMQCLYTLQLLSCSNLQIISTNFSQNVKAKIECPFTSVNASGLLEESAWIDFNTASNPPTQIF